MRAILGWKATTKSRCSTLSVVIHCHVKSDKSCREDPRTSTTVSIRHMCLGAVFWMTCYYLFPSQTFWRELPLARHLCVVKSFPSPKVTPDEPTVEAYVCNGQPEAAAAVRKPANIKIIAIRIVLNVWKFEKRTEKYTASNKSVKKTLKYSWMNGTRIWWLW